MILKGHLVTKHLKMVIFSEGDFLIKKTMKDDVEEIKSKLQKNIQKIIFSQCLTPKLINFSK